MDKGQLKKQIVEKSTEIAKKLSEAAVKFAKKVRELINLLADKIIEAYKKYGVKFLAPVIAGIVLIWGAIIALIVAIFTASSVSFERDYVVVDLYGSQDLGYVQKTSSFLPGGPKIVPNDKLQYEILNPEVASIVGGRIVGNGVGKAAVVVHMGSKTDTCYIEVKVKADSLSMNVRNVRIRVDGKAKLKATLYPANARGTRTITWTSSDTTVAVVNEKGVVYARNPGTAMVTANAEGLYTDCEISVATPREWQTEMSRLAQKRGGKVNGQLRFTLIWNDRNGYNGDDLDAHCIEPNGNEISFQNKNSRRSGGKLDVDIINPVVGQKAIENISWTNVERLKKNSAYKFSVHRFSDRGGSTGFRAEIEFDGQIYTYNYKGNWRSAKKWKGRNVPYVPIANMHVDEDGELYIENILRPTRR